MGFDIRQIDRLVGEVRDGHLSRRDLIKRAGALGLSVPAIGAILQATSPAAMAQEGGVTLSFDAGATGGGGGKPNATLLEYCRLIDGGSQFELDRMVDIRLVTLSADLNTFTGELAESWEVDETANKVTFKLRPNATWHDGQPLTADDVVFTINTIVNPATNSRWHTSFGSVAGYTEMRAGTGTELPGVKAVDPTTVTVELTQADSGFLPGFIFISVIPKHILDGTDLTKIAENPNWTQNRVGAGPFKFIKIVEGERIEMEAFADYILGKPAIDKLNLLFFQSFETSLAAFQQGTNMAAPMTVLNLELVQGTAGAEVVTTPAGVGAIWVNTKHGQLADVRVRQAISYAIDRKTITDNLFQGYANPVSSELPYLPWTQAPDLNPYDYDPEKAKSLLTEAGFTGDETYKLWYYYADQLTASVMEAVQQYLDAVGIKVTLQFDDASGARQKEFDEGTWHLIYGSYGAQPNPAALSVIFGAGAKERYSYSSADFDAAMEAALRSYDQAEQGTHYQTAIKILNTDLPWVYLFDRKNLIAVNTKLKTGEGTNWGPGSVLYANNAHTWTVT